MGFKIRLIIYLLAIGISALLHFVLLEEALMFVCFALSEVMFYIQNRLKEVNDV